MWAEQVQAMIAANGGTNASFNQILREQGVPNVRDTGETNYWAYRDAFRIPRATLATINNTTALFTHQIFSGQRSNLLFPITSNLIYANFKITSYVNFSLSPELLEDPTLLDAQALNDMVMYFLMGTKLEIVVANKQYLNKSLWDFANFAIAPVLDGADGQNVSTPLAISPFGFQQHHKTSLLLDPFITWPANGAVDITVTCQPANFYRDLTEGTLPDATTAPWNISIEPVLHFELEGVQARVLK